MSERWLLPPLWFDFCWEIGGFDEIPFPLAVRSHGETLEERAVLRQRSVPQMQAAGLLDGAGLAPRLAKVFGIIAKPGLWVEGLWLPDDTSDTAARLLSIATEEGALLVVQGPGEDDRHGGDLNITIHPRTSPGAAAVQGMPPAPQGGQGRMVAPLSEIAPAESTEDEHDGGSGMQPPPRPGGRNARTARAMRNLLEQQHFRDGQFTANLRDRTGRTHRSSVLRWFDAYEPDGRYGVHNQPKPGSEPELVLAPLGPADIGKALDGRVQEVRSAASG